jgi:hypothetical protein
MASFGRGLPVAGSIRDIGIETRISLHPGMFVREPVRQVSGQN